MSKTTDMLSAKKIYNDWDIASRGSKVMLSYRARDLGRGGCCAAWVVCHTRKKYKGAWYDYGAKVFIAYVDREAKAEVFNEALAFATFEAKREKWARSPFGGYLPVCDIEAVGVRVPDAKIVEYKK